MWWLPQTPTPDCRVAFRARFDLRKAGEVEIQTCGASWFVVRLDGDLLTEGPLRFSPDRPEYGGARATLAAGPHVLAFHAVWEGVETKRMRVIPPFVWGRVFAGGEEQALSWRCAPLIGQRPQTRRITGDCGWADWRDTRQEPDGWERPDFDDGHWERPIKASGELGEFRASSLGPLRLDALPLSPIAEGRAAETFGYDTNDPPVRFFLRDLDCADLPPQGVWRRYDLGRVRLGRPRFVLDLPPCVTVEFGYSESLRGGRVAPWVTLGAPGPSCALDHFIARGGRQEFSPLTPKGGRYLEIHVMAPPESIAFVREEFIERGYYPAPVGDFTCDDERLERVWALGTETLRACTEDAVTDCPTRERGQWTGDAAVALEIASVGWPDLRPIRRMLAQAAASARTDGMVACLSPSGDGVVTTYAAQWVGACVRYHQLTGERAVLEELWPAAERNLAAFEPFWTPDGLGDGAGWGFVDWGYARPDGPIDPALNLHFLAALRAMIHWGALLGRLADRWAAWAMQAEAALRRWLGERLGDWGRIGHHAAALALGAGLFDAEHEEQAVEYVKAHWGKCFPNDSDAPRLSDPAVADARLITPYFAHFAFPPLIERGQMSFVLEQYRRCWGWMLDGGHTTCLEVFDTRWSHCHQWSGCPTWQLSRYALGLDPRFDCGPGHFTLCLEPAGLERASGVLPRADGGAPIRVQWERRDGHIEYHVETPDAVTLNAVTFRGRHTLRLDSQGRMHD